MIQVRFFNWTGYHSQPWRSIFWLINLFSRRTVHVDIVLRSGNARAVWISDGKRRKLVGGSDDIIAQATISHGAALFSLEATPQKSCAIFSLPITPAQAWDSISPLLGETYSLGTYPGAILSGLPNIPGTNCAEFIATVLQNIKTEDPKIQTLQATIKERRPWTLTPGELRDILEGAGFAPL